MKKLLLTAVIATCTLFASAQIMLVTTYDNNDGVEGMDKITNMAGIGYMATDKITAGVQKSGDDYKLFVRYAVKDDFYAVMTMPTEDGSDNMHLGLGYAVNVWNNVYFEPSYTMPAKEDENGDREGTFNFGLSYRF